MLKNLPLSLLLRRRRMYQKWISTRLCASSSLLLPKTSFTSRKLSFHLDSEIPSSLAASSRGPTIETLPCAASRKSSSASRWSCAWVGEHGRSIAASASSLSSTCMWWMSSYVVAARGVLSLRRILRRAATGSSTTEHSSTRGRLHW